MKSLHFIYLVGSMALSTLLFTGCGNGNTSITKQPHDTSKLGRTVSIKKDWTWDVSSSAVLRSGGDITLVTTFWAGLPDKVENYQYFIDIDKNKNTGYSGENGWEINGADYLIENGDIYKSLSHTKWKWKYIGEFQTSLLNNEKGFVEDESLLMRMPTIPLKLEKIFNIDSFNAMIEVYDKNWEGDSNTITGIVVNVNNKANPVSDTITKENAKKILQTRYKQNIVKDIYSLKKLTEDKYLVKYRLNVIDTGVSNAYIYAIVDFKAKNSHIIVSKHFTDWSKDPITRIDTNSNTISYVKEKIFTNWDNKYQSNFENTEHIKINFNTYKTVDSYIIQKVGNKLKESILNEFIDKHVYNKAGYIKKDAVIYGYDHEVFLYSETNDVSPMGNPKFLVKYDITDLNMPKEIELNSSPGRDFKINGIRTKNSDKEVSLDYYIYHNNGDTDRVLYNFIDGTKIVKKIPYEK